MPRRLDIGTYGEIGYLDLPDEHVKARARFRDYDGTTRIVSRTGPTRAAARRALKAALAERRGAGGVDVNSNTRLSVLAELWLEQDHDWSTGTRRTYGVIVGRNVVPALGSVRVGEATPATIARALDAIKARHPSAAKTARACLSGMFGLALAHEAVRSNPVRDAPTRISVKPKRPRALSVDEAVDLSDWLRTDAWAVEHDLPDLIDFLLATGARIGEACAARHGPNRDGEPLLDLDAGTWEIDGTVVRVPRVGLRVQDKPKTAAGWRRIALPPHAVDMLRRRQNELRPASSLPVVFGAPAAKTLRDPSNTAADLREVLKRYRQATGVDLTWVTFHTFRKTVATRMEEAGCTPREVADQLGHSKVSMTLDVYFGRAVVTSRAAEILAR